LGHDGIRAVVAVPLLRDGSDWRIVIRRKVSAKFTPSICETAANAGLAIRIGDQNARLLRKPGEE